MPTMTRVAFVIPPETYFAILLTTGRQWASEATDALQDFRDGAALARSAPWWPDYLTRLARNPYTHMHALHHHYLHMRTL